MDLDNVRAIAERVASSSGYELVEIEFLGGGKARMLRVFLDKPEGITHEDCAIFTRDFGTILDVEDAIPGGAYTLEVSSPGLDRKLSKPADFERFTGSLVKLMTREPVRNNRHWEGRLESFSDGKLTLDLSTASRKKKKQQGEGKVEIALENVERANLVPEI